LGDSAEIGLDSFGFDDKSHSARLGKRMSVEAESFAEKPFYSVPFDGIAKPTRDKNSIGELLRRLPDKGMKCPMNPCTGLEK